jgi:hypothetical protein
MPEDVKLLEHDMRLAKQRVHGGKDGLTGCISKRALYNAVRSEGIGVLSPEGEGYWNDMRRRYPHLNLNGNRVPTGCNIIGTVNRLGRVSDRFRCGHWEHWDARRREWVPGETTARKGVL